MRSFDSSRSTVVKGERGQLAHRRSYEQVERLARRMYTVRPGVWCLVGNGLSNQTFVEGPDGIIAIDTGESVQEMRDAIRELRQFTDRPIVAVLYTHFHYVSGTTAVFEESGGPVPVHGHERIALNRSRVSTEIAPAYSRGLVYQFGTSLPVDGPDGLVSAGLGLYYRNPEHAPFTNGFVKPDSTWVGGEKLVVAGLRIEIEYAPSDADDSVTIWFPDLSVCVQNIVWPVLFNVFAIRGEEYRDPRVLLRGVEHVASLQPEYLVTCHGPPIQGSSDIVKRVTRYRDSLQFMWDQTVRALNRGDTADQIAHAVRLPDFFDDDYLTTEFYGVTEHHVRQIATGLRGWFDGDPSKLFPLEPTERFTRLVVGFGGRDVVRRIVTESIEADDLRWALELATWLSRSEGSTDDDRGLLAKVLREIGYRSSAANIRNWCLTAARDIDGTNSLDRLRKHRIREAAVNAGPTAESLDQLRVTLDPVRALGIDHHIGLQIADDPAPVGLHIRNCVAVVTDAQGATDHVRTDRATWASILAGRVHFDDAIVTGSLVIEGDASRVGASLSVFDLDGLAR